MSIRRREWTARDGGRRSAWQVDYVDQMGRRRSKQFARKKDAEAFLHQAQAEVRQGTHTVGRESVTVAQAAQNWLADRGRANLEPTTLAAYEQHVRLHIVPLCGNVRLSELTAPRVEGFLNSWSESLSPAMTKRVLRSFKAILATAMRQGHVGHNVAIAVRTARRRRKQSISIPSKTVLRSILDSAPANGHPATGALMTLLIFTGLRISEARGLSWSHVDLQKRTVSVVRRANNAGVLGPPKSEAGTRTIPLPPICIATLRAWKLRCAPSELDLVFPSPKGRVMNYGYMVQRMLIPALAGAGEVDVRVEGGREVLTPRYSFHAFRHAAASLWIEQKLSPKRVQTLMGHSSITMTFDVYGHLFEQHQSDHEVATAMEAQIFSDAT